MIFNQKEIIHTAYGYRRAGRSPFVVVAPHAAGDDHRTNMVSKILAKKLDAFLISNRKYIKPQNKTLIVASEFKCDFNSLSWDSKKNRYFWRGFKYLKTFYNDIKDYCDRARQYSKDNKAVALYIHGFENGKTGIDLGAGLKSINNKDRLVYSLSHNKKNTNTGIATMKISQLKRLKKRLEKKLIKDYNLKVSVGKIYSGWSKSSAIQYHKHEGRKDYALQIEISAKLRKNKRDIEYLAHLLSEEIKKVFL